MGTTGDKSAGHENLCSRRTLLSSVGGVLFLSGCSSTPSNTAGSTTRQTAIGERRTVHQVDSLPSCETSDSGHLFIVESRGLTVTVETEEKADEIRDLMREETDLPEDGVRIQNLDSEDRPKYAVELDIGYNSVESARDRIGDDDAVQSIRRGQSLPTVRSVANKTKAQIDRSTELNPDTVDVRIIQPPLPEARSVVASLTGLESPSLIERSESFEVRVESGDGEEVLLDSEDVSSISVVESKDDDEVRVELKLSDPAANRFARTLEEVGALDNPTDQLLTISYDDEVIAEGYVSPELSEKIQNGEWDENFSFPLIDERVAEELSRTSGLFQFSAPVRTRFRKCE